MSPLVSVIIPNYNHAPYLKQRIESVLNQSYQHFELIILDDCSTDNSRTILEMYRDHPKVSGIFFNNINTGSPFKQWDKGIRLAKGEYIWIAESDDYAAKSFLEKSVYEMQRNKNAGIHLCGSHWVNQNNEIGRDLCIHQHSFIKHGHDEIRNFLVRHNTIQNVSAVLFRKSVFENISNRYKNYKACGDWILYIEILAQTNFVFSSEKLNYFRFYHSNTSNAAAKKGMWESEGVDVLELSDRVVHFSKDEKSNLLEYWRKRIAPLRKTIPFSLLKYLQIQYKFFKFSPLAYLKKSM